MTMRTLLLVSAAVLLAGLVHGGTIRLNENLKSIFDLAEKFNETFNQAYFVEDVGILAQGSNRCEDKFFCKVHDILHKHEHFAKGKEAKEEKDLVRNLDVYIRDRHANCTELLMNVTPSNDTKPIPVLVGHLTSCIRHKNLHGNR
ncbi:interleukin-13 [Acanthopagrus schlegelii]